MQTNQEQSETNEAIEITNAAESLLHLRLIRNWPQEVSSSMTTRLTQDEIDYINARIIMETTALEFLTSATAEMHNAIKPAWRMVLQQTTDVDSKRWNIFDKDGTILATYINSVEIFGESSNGFFQAIQSITQTTSDRIDVEEICIDRSKLPWAMMSNASSSFGGRCGKVALKAFKRAFRSGFCYLNLFVDLSYHINEANAERFAKFLVQLPTKLEAYPDFHKLSAVMLEMTTLFPETIHCSIPLISIHPTNPLIHVSGKEGVPRDWYVLEVTSVADLSSVLAQGKYSAILEHRVGATQLPASYLGWNLKHSVLVKQRWMRAYQLACELNNPSLKSDELDERVAAADRLTTVFDVMEETPFARDRRFTGDAKDGYIIYVYLDNPTVASKIEDIESQAVWCTKNPTEEAFDTLQYCIDQLTDFLSKDDIFPSCYTRERFERTFALTWDHRYSDVQINALKTKEFLLHCNSAKKKGFFILSTNPSTINWNSLDYAYKIVDLPYVQPRVSRATQEKADIVAIGTHQPTGATSNTTQVVAKSVASIVLSTMLSVICGYYFSRWWKHKNKPYGLRRKFPWVYKRSPGGDSDDDDGDDSGFDGQPRSVLRRRPIQSVHLDSFDEMVDINLGPDAEHYARHSERVFLQLREFIAEGAIQPISHQITRIVAALQSLQSLNPQQRIYTLFIQLSTAVRNAYLAYYTSGTIEPEILENVEQAETELRVSLYTGPVASYTNAFKEMMMRSVTRMIHGFYLELLEANYEDFKSIVNDMDLNINLPPDTSPTHYEAQIIRTFQSALKALRATVLAESESHEATTLGVAERSFHELSDSLGYRRTLPSYFATRMIYVGAPSRPSPRPEDTEPAIPYQEPPETAPKPESEQDKLIKLHQEKAKLEIEQMQAVTNQQQEMMQMSRNAQLRENITAPLNVLSNAGFTGAMLYGMRRNSTPAAQTIQPIPSLSPLNFLQPGGQRLGGTSVLGGRKTFSRKR